MLVNEMIAEVQRLALEEYGRASEKYGATHHTQHEGYAVMREEFQEAVEALNDVGELLEDKYWSNVRKDNFKANKQVESAIYSKAVLAACECIQVAAMAHKSLMSRKENE